MGGGLPCGGGCRRWGGGAPVWVGGGGVGGGGGGAPVWGVYWLWRLAAGRGGGTVWAGRYVGGGGHIGL